MRQLFKKKIILFSQVTNWDTVKLFYTRNEYASSSIYKRGCRKSQILLKTSRTFGIVRDYKRIV